MTFTGYQRMLNALNPEISLTGDFISYYRTPSRPSGPPFLASSGQNINTWLGEFPAGNRFFLRGAELNVVAPLDPYTRGKFFFDVPADGGGTLASVPTAADGSLGIEEVYMEWIHLPTNLNLKIGYFLNQFGQLNRWHEHALPQVDRPHLLATFLGVDGLDGLGMSFNWVLGRLWSHVNEVHVEFISGGDGVSFTTAGKKDLVALARLKNYWDLSQDTYLEIGLSAAQGHNDPDGLYGTTLGAIDLNYKWVPAGRGHYRTFDLRSEVFVSRRDTPTGTVESLGTYLSVQNRLSARLWTSLRLDYAQLPWDSDQNIKGAAVTLDYWQSEFVFFRLQLDRVERTFADSATRLFLQTVWSMGPHKHEAY